MLDQSTSLSLSRQCSLLDIHRSGASDCSQSKKRYEENIARWKIQLSQQAMEKDEIKEYLEWGLQLISNLKKHYFLSETATKQRIIGSIFPEKLIFRDGELRTKRINSFISLFASEKGGNKKGQLAKFGKLSNLVSPEGIEPTAQ